MEECRPLIAAAPGQAGAQVPMAYAETQTDTLARHMRTLAESPRDPSVLWASTDDGNVQLIPDPRGPGQVAHVMTKAELADPPPGPRYKAHFATCGSS